MSQAGRHGDHDRRPGGRDRRGRRPLRAGPLHPRHHDRHRPGAVDQAEQRQPGLLRAVRPRPAVRDPAQRCRPRHRAGAASFDPSLLSHEKEGDLLRALAEFPRVVAAAAQLREPHRVARYLEETAGEVPPVLRRLPGAPDGRRGARRRSTTRGCCSSRRPAPCSPTDCDCSGSPPPSACNGARARSGLGPRRGLVPRARVAARAAGRQRPGPAALVLDGPQERRRRAGGRRGRPARPGRRARLPGLRPGRGRLPVPGPGVPGGLRRLRRLLRRQGVPVHDGRALGRRGGALPRRLLGR